MKRRAVDISTQTFSFDAETATTDMPVDLLVPIEFAEPEPVAAPNVVVDSSGARFSEVEHSVDEPSPTIRSAMHGDQSGLGTPHIAVALPTDAPVPDIPDELSENTRVSLIDVDDVAPTVQAGNASIGDARQNAFTATGVGVGDDGKPPYRIPLMSEIAEYPKNGLVMVSTFSGCGGSCLGFKMAGYDVRWANEFIPAAQATYRANHPSTHLDTSDIRKVTAESIRAVIGDVDLDVFEGSPPCASFSTAGKTSKGWGEVRDYSDTKQRTDDLFEQYIRLLTELKPRAFVAENVSGMVKGVAKGYFKRYLAAFEGLPYNVEARLLDAQWLGVPQRRVRLIFVGVRKDVGSPAWPTKLPHRYSIRDAIPWIGTSPVDRRVEPESALGPAVGAEWEKIGPNAQSDKYLSLIRPSETEPCPTVTAVGGTGAASVAHPYERRKFTIAELRRICGFPDDFVLTGSYAAQWERLGRAVPPPMMYSVAATLAREVFKKDIPRGLADTSVLLK